MLGDWRFSGSHVERRNEYVQYVIEGLVNYELKLRFEVELKL